MGGDRLRDLQKRLEEVEAEIERRQRELEANPVGGS